MTDTLIPPVTQALTPDEFDELDGILDDLRTRNDETPQWEFCEGFMAAVLCCRRPITTSECLAVLLDITEPSEPGTAGEGSFSDPKQAQRFMTLWTRRWNEIAEAINTRVESLEDERAYYPEVMDVRGALAAMTEAERAEAQAAISSDVDGDIDDDSTPAFGQVWAIGFMFAVESWPDEWAAPRDKAAVKWLDEGLQAIVAMTEDDTDPPTIAVFGDDTPPSVSEKRFNAFADAIWAVYDLREMWRNIGPRVATVHKVATPGRNDVCHCGSGKKFKKCHGAN
jgi:uncharacterized protein